MGIDEGHVNDTEHSGIELSSGLLEIVRTLALELAPQRAGQPVTLDSLLDRELGFDSLSRVELLLRIERQFDVRLSEHDFSQAETAGDLLQAVLASRTQHRGDYVAPVVDQISLGATDTVPAHIDTLQGVLAWRAEQQPDRPHVLLYEPDAEAPITISFADLQQGAQRLAAGLQDFGLEPAQAVAIMLPTSRQYLESFFGVLVAGGVPVPIYPPARLSQLEDHLNRHVKILDNAQVRFLITVPEGRSVGRLLRRRVATLKAVLTPQELFDRTGTFIAVPASAEDVALLQYTSGSTGQPKGVILTHANLLANIRAMGERVQAESRDVFVSWLPLYHDMGLIGAWLGSLYYAMLAVLLPPTAFLARPWRWLQSIQQHGATISAAPNFAYEMCLSKIPDSELAGLDLASLRLLFNGAEPVSPHTLRNFTERFARHGLAPEVLAPVYGLAEAAVGLAFPPLHRRPLIDRIQRETFERTGRAVAVTADELALEFVACGQPLRGYEIRIVDESDRELGDREEGHLQFRGPSATRGYIGNPQATAQLFHHDWLDSGDLAYISGGDVFLTGRVKDLIIRAGRNIYPYELEEAIGKLPEIRKGCVAVFGSRERDSDIEQLIVVAETRQSDQTEIAGLQRRIETLASDLLGTPPDDILLVAPRTVLKTSSGKLRRAACRELYEQGRIAQGPQPASWQIVRLWLAGLRPQWRRRLRTLGDLCYAAWVYLAFGLMMPIAMLGLLAVPSLAGRWQVLGHCARLLLRLSRVPLVVQGMSNIPRNQRCVLVSNHASYLDGLLLVSVLPDPVVFVAKAELAKRPFARWFLERINAVFVERFDAEQGTADARSLAEQARQGARLLFFPEGTFTRYPGLLGFHMGAFAAAAESELPVVPITIRGSRSVLRSDDWYPRRGTIAIVVGEPLAADGTGWEAALQLRNRAREEILRHVGEQDLVLERTPGR